MNKQTGSALIISLLILLVMTLLGISAMSTSTLEEKMAANDRNQKMSFMNAELTLTNSEEDFIFSKTIRTDIQGAIGTSAGYYDIGTNLDYFDTANWVPGSTCIAMPKQSCASINIISDAPPLEAGGGYGQASQSNISHKIIQVSARSDDSAVSMVQSTIRKVVLQ
ncbi:MAG TPA: hypothetical protein ENJ65_03725 [Candidatus Tenderia electrophaga]|uniref:Type 4 fimbrial biogenesis protein PilX N-terminal domain-containing protein n=1 Tax=Candidatus Tenderia electrophaga TaxID=1748243 RepID=A0A832N3R6_9GAMM|nr:hypothetical protein [Candidatus Tenderia electrophaga]